MDPKQATAHRRTGHDAGTGPAGTFDTICLIGIGLIGSSLARGIRRRKLCRKLVVCTRSAATQKRARALQLGDVYTRDPVRAVRDADLVVLCIPLLAYEAMMQRIAPALKPGAVLSDVGSAKVHVMEIMGRYCPEGVHLIPGHPIAGTEYSGPDAGFAELFEHRWVILTPPPGTEVAAQHRLACLWQEIGSLVTVMDGAHHDRVLALTSHLPHLIAYAIVGTAAQLEEDSRSEVIRFSASGFRDFTRIADSDPVMWRDVFLVNREGVLEILSRFRGDLERLEAAIVAGDGAFLEDWFTRTRAIRTAVISARQA